MRPVRKFVWEDADAIIEPRMNAAGLHEWPFDPAFPIDVRFLAMRREAETRMSFHDYLEILYLHSGEVTCQIGDRQFPLKEGGLLVMGAAVPHRLIPGARSQVKAVVLHFLPELIRAHDPTGDDVEYLMPFLVQGDGFPHLVPAKSGIPAQIFDLMRRAHAELPAQTQRARLSVRTYFKMMLVLLVNYYSRFRGLEPAFHHKQRNLERLLPLFEYIERSYQNEITVDDAAATVNMSKSHFMRFFKQVTGQPLMAHLNQFRVVKAQRLLATTDKSIAEIGLEAGFSSQSYFGLVFRRLTHFTPRAYRDRCSTEQKRIEIRPLIKAG